MTDGSLTRERILDAAEDVLRRHGPGKATVLDVARALDVSHGTIYRHFPSKAALHDAVAERWLVSVSEPLGAIAGESGTPAVDRLRRWFRELMALKRQRLESDPELFATYLALAEDTRTVVLAHVAELVGQVGRIVGDGMIAGDFETGDPEKTANALLMATLRFHHPKHAESWSDPERDTEFDILWALLLRGLLRNGEGQNREQTPDNAV